MAARPRVHPFDWRPIIFPFPTLASNHPITGVESAPKLPTIFSALFRALSQFFSDFNIVSIRVTEPGTI